MKYLDALKERAGKGGSVGFVGTLPPTHTEFQEVRNSVLQYTTTTKRDHIGVRASDGEENSIDSTPYLPTKPTKTIPSPEQATSVGFVGERWRRPDELADWPIDLRQRWGDRANELEAEGVPWPEHEIRAFTEIKAMGGLS